MKLSLFTDNTTFHTENPKETSLKKKVLELIDKFNKVARYKINIQKSITFLHACNQQSENEIKKIIPFTKASKRTKYLGINLIKEVQNLCFENYKTLKEMKEYLSKWGKIPCS